MLKTQPAFIVELFIYLFGTSLMLSAGAIIGASVMNKQVNQLKVEAVKRGYAEWVGDEGQPPNVWRWK